MTTRVGHVKKAQAQIRIENRGAEQATRDVILDREGTEVDTQSVTLDVDEETTITLADDTFGESDIGSMYDYEVDTGHRNPTFDVEVIGLLVVSGETNVPTFDVGRIDWEQDGELHFEDTDELRLVQ